jgi:titin
MCGTVGLTWTAPTTTLVYPVTGYLVFRGTGPLDMAPLATTGNSTSYDDHDVLNGRTYYYKVASLNMGGVSNFTLTLPGFPTGPPSEPLDLRAVAGITNVTLGWSAPVTDGGRTLLGYRVLRGPSPGALSFLMEVGPRTTSIVDSGLSEHIQYYYAVRAFNSLGEGPLATAVPATPFTAPGPPAGFKVTAGFLSAELSWSAPPDDGGMAIRGFIVRRGTSGARLDPIAMVGGASYGYSDGHTPYRQPAYYSITAYNDAGEGAPTAVLSVLPMTLPDPPNNVLATDGPGSIVLTWAYPPQDGGSSVTQYLIFRGATITGLSRIGTADGAAMSFSDGTIEPGVHYYYAVSAVTAVGQGLRSDAIEAIGLDPPSAPSRLSYGLAGGAVVLTWSPPARDGGRPVLGYRVYRGAEAASMALVASVPDVSTYSDDLVVANETYFYAVTALNDIGEGPRTQPLMVPLNASLLLPGPPTGLRALADGTTVRLVWLPPDAGAGGPVTGYRVYRGLLPGDLVCVGTVGIVPGYKDPGLDAGRTYHYAIAAENSAGEGERSPIVVLELAKAEAVVPIVGPVVLAVLAVTGSVIILIAAAISIETVRYGLVLLLLPLFSRFKREQVLANKTRYAIHGLIIDRPGIHFSAIIEDLELPLGVATYHLDVLERENFVKSARDGRLKRFYSTDSVIPNEFRLSPEQLRMRLLELIAGRRGMSQKEIIREMGIDREIVGYHLRELVREGSIRDARVGRYKVYSATRSLIRDLEGGTPLPEHRDSSSRRG